jgi:hypothetical protein
MERVSAHFAVEPTGEVSIGKFSLGARDMGMKLNSEQKANSIVFLPLG